MNDEQKLANTAGIIQLSLATSDNHLTIKSKAAARRVT